MTTPQPDPKALASELPEGGLERIRWLAERNCRVTGKTILHLLDLLASKEQEIENLDREWNNAYREFKVEMGRADQAEFLLSVLAACAEGEEEEAYQLGKRDGYESAVQDIDLLTGGDGEYRFCTDGDPDRHTPDAATMKQRIADRFRATQEENERLKAKLGAPELHDFAAGVVLEAAHQRERWAAGHDAGKAPEDWFWLLGYLGGKALHAAKTGDTDKALHHTISTAAALANWHAALMGSHTGMRPGIDPAERGIS